MNYRTDWDKVEIVEYFNADREIQNILPYYIDKCDSRWWRKSASEFNEYVENELDEAVLLRVLFHDILKMPYTFKINEEWDEWIDEESVVLCEIIFNVLVIYANNEDSNPYDSVFSKFVDSDTTDSSLKQKEIFKRAMYIYFTKLLDDKNFTTFEAVNKGGYGRLPY